MKINEQYALISTYNKVGLDKVCYTLNNYNIKIISTGSTSQHIKKLGYACQSVSSLTKFKEILDGRVKTLNHKIHASLLYDRKKPSHIKTFKKLNFPSINFVIVNLYPFGDAIKNNNTNKQCLDMIDIGGVALLRASAKNFEAITTITNPLDYENFSKSLNKNKGKTTLNFRKQMAVKAFEVTSFYDQTITSWIAQTSSPIIKFNNLDKHTLKYGENPNQKSFFVSSQRKNFFDYKFNGKDIGYNNILDLNSGIDCLMEFTEPTCVIIKHSNPSGVASKKTIKTAFIKAYEADPISAFGGIVTLNREVEVNLAKIISTKFFEIVAAPSFSLEAKKILQQKKKLILISTNKIIYKDQQEIRTVLGGYLIQDRNKTKILNKNLINVSHYMGNKFILDDLVFALKVCKHVKSNAIVIAKNKQTIGIGSGQMSRIDATNIAINKQNVQYKYKKSVAASDAFFPFVDSLKKLIKNNCIGVVQPSGSKNDYKIVNYAKKNKLPLYFVDYRLFKH